MAGAAILRQRAEHGLERKCEQVLGQLQRGEAEIDFDPDTDSIDIRPVSKNRRDT